MSYSSEVLADSPSLYARLGDASGATSGTESSPNARTINYSNVTLGVAGAIVGDANTAGSFNGSSSVASVAYGDSNGVGLTYTIEAWVKTSNAGSGFRHVAGWRGDTTATFAGYLYTDGNKPGFLVFSTGSASHIALGATAINDGQWHHLVGTIDGTTVRLYVDGTQVATAAMSGTVRASSSASFSIGSAMPAGREFAGTVDEVAHYTTALSATRVTAHYNAGTSLVAATVTLAATLQSKTAAFTAATVLGATLAGSMQPKTATFALDIPAAPDRTVSLSATLRAKTATGTILGATDTTLAATLRPKTSAFTILGGASMSLAGQLQPKVADVSLETAKTFRLAGSLRRKTASVTISAQPVIRLVGELGEKVAEFAAVAMPTAGLVGTLQAKVATFMLRGITPVTPIPEPLRQAGPAPVVVARALGPVTAMTNGTQPVYAVSQASKQRARQQIVVDGVDISFLRGVRTPDVTYTLLSPLRYGPGQLDLPQVVACMESLGEDDPSRAADLSWMREGAPVEVHLVLDDPADVDPPQVVVRDVYKGIVVAWDIDGPGLSIELGGEANGRAALRDRQDVIFPRVNDIGHQISDAVRDLGLPVYPALGTVTGIEVLTTGGVGHLEHIQNKVAEAWTRQGNYWTVMPNDAGAYVVQRKSDNVRHATVYFDDARTVPRLRRDLSEEPNRIFITGVTPQGQRVRFGVYPGLIQGPVPDFPGHMAEGDTGEGVRLLIGKLHAVGYLKLVEVAGGYDNDVVAAVKDLQDDAGLPKTGEVNLATWEALYDLNVTTTSLEGAHIEPAAQDTRVRRWDRSGSGTIMGFNDDYEPEVLPRDRTIDAGVGKTRSQLREFARTVLEAASAPNWVGDIVFHAGGLVSGEHALGSTITAGDVMDARELVPTMNLWAPGFDGGTQFNVSALQVAGDGTVTATVDTRFRDALEVWDIIDRNRESRNDPARRSQQRHRSSTIRKDSIGHWDEIGGLLGHDVRLEAGWNVFEVVAAMEGTIARLRLELNTPAEFACAVFGRPVDVGFLNDVIGNPLTASGERNWRRKATRARLREQWNLYASGTRDEPCGYGEDLKSDGAELTGVHVDEAGFAYRSESRTLLYVAVYVRDENTIPLGRIMWPQLEAGA